MFFTTSFVPSVAASVSWVRCQRGIGVSHRTIVFASRWSSGTPLAVQWS
jgi:hypothetical protein